MVVNLRKAYLAVVNSTAMEDLPVSNDVRVAMLLKGDVDIIDCLNSDYIFSKPVGGGTPNYLVPHRG